MAAFVWEPMAWAELQFSECELGDRRRNKRLIKLAQQIADRPDSGTPDQTETWGDLKAAYRLFNEEDVTPAALLEPHRRQTRAVCHPSDVKLIVCDTTELDYTSHKKAKGLGPIGNGGGCGFLAHTALMIDAQTRVADGIVAQELYHRKSRGQSKRKANQTVRRSADRESAVWGRVIDQAGRPPEGVTWLHVCDRGADDIEVFHRAITQGCGFVIRAGKLNRKVLTIDGRLLPLSDVLAEWMPQGERDIAVPAKDKQPSRVARMAIRFGTVCIPVPKILTPWLKAHRPLAPLTLQVVELIELHPPKGVQPIRWVLYTTEPANDIATSNAVIAHYEKRWVVEDFHKCWKTGCRVEARQYETSEALERVATVLAIVAVRLLQLRTAAKETPDRPAEEIAPKKWVQMLRTVRKLSADRPITIHNFVRHLAGLGGFLMRKSDGEPGWITIWRGYEKLNLMLRGADAVQRRCG